MTTDTKQIRIVSPSDVLALTFAGEGQVIGGHYLGGIRRWKIEDGQQQSPTMGANGIVASLAISQDGRWLVSGDRGKTAIVWNAATQEKAHELKERAGYVLGVDISSDSTNFAIVDYNNAEIFSITSGIRLLAPVPHTNVTGVKFSPDGSRFATASETHGVRVYSTHNGNILFDSGQKGSSGSWPVAPLAWSSDGQQLFVASVGKITCFDLSKSLSSEWSIHEDQSRVSIASNGRFIACAAGSSISLWDCVSHKQISSIITYTSQINCLALSPSGGCLACGIGKNTTTRNLRDVLPLEYFEDSLPLVRMSGKILKSWTQNDPTNTEVLLSDELTRDAKESLRVRPSPIGHIAMAVALLNQGDRDGALWTFDFAFQDCELYDISFLLLLKVRKMI
ncbi:hypothetical protein M404DRAFT_720150 [Pisolithus tinctorius Marx 270]|uniref:Uncharacterized protein n=1 Tax=Pisolithus tinctorius Marx 270 TaxID=870435 RepID=A0A0C3JX54_PISTI|nr:hypothetical protein M404DRAFT_720150 [Pisolithus tinctorius Marx 270]